MHILRDGFDGEKRGKIRDEGVPYASVIMFAWKSISSSFPSPLTSCLLFSGRCRRKFTRYASRRSTAELSG